MKLKLEELMSHLGNPGRYQILIFILLALNYFPLVFNHVVMAFFGSKPPHQCHSAALEGQETSMDSSSVNQSGATFQSTDFGKCVSLYKLSDGSNVTVTCPSSGKSYFLYSTMERETTIVTEWDLVCDKAYMSSLATTIYFCGVMVGGMVFGHLADKFGRKPIMLGCLYMQVVVGLGTAFVPWYSFFVSLRFLQGILMQGLQISTYTMAMELFLPHHRGYAGTLIECVWGLSVICLGGLAYLIRDWRRIQLAISLPSLLAVSYICLLPESLRWLIMKNKTDEAEKLVNKITRVNNIEFPHRNWEDVKLQLGMMDGAGNQQYSFLDMMKTPVLRKRSLILFYLWFCISLGYYGLTWKLTKLAGNKYLNFFIGAMVEFVAYVLVIYITKRFGRRRPLVFCFIMAAVMCIGSGSILIGSPAVDSPWSLASTGLAIAGKFAMGGLFSTIFLYTSELYPTVIRNIGMGSCAFWTRVGGVIAPQILFLDQFANKALPMILFGAVTLIGGCLTLMLPETLGRKLPDTIEDAESMSNYGDCEGPTATELEEIRSGEQTDLPSKQML